MVNSDMRSPWASGANIPNKSISKVENNVLKMSFMTIPAQNFINVDVERARQNARSALSQPPKNPMIKHEPV
jgi:hypothetical protein